MHRPPPHRAGVAGWLAAFVAALALGVLWASPAGAHSVLESSSPTSGETVATSPQRITLTFNEPVSLPDRAVRVLDSDGDDVDLGAVRAVDSVVTAKLSGELADGSYVVAWKVMSADSHPVSGAFTFAVGAPSTPAGDTSVLDRVTAAESTTGGARAAVDIAAALAYAGVLLTIGLASFAAFVAPDDREGAAAGTARRVAVWAAAVGAVGLVASVVTGAILVDGGGLSFPSWGSIGDEVVGAAGLQALLGVVGLAALVASLRPSLPRRVFGLLTVDGAVTAVAAFVIVGHTRTASPVGLTIAADVAHLAAAAVWAGGLLGLLLHLRAGNEETVGRDASVVVRFSDLATLAIVAVAVAGAFLGWRIVGSWNALWNTTYGVLLLVKVGLFAVVAAIGAYNKWWIIGRGESGADVSRGRLLRTLTAEAVVVLAIVGVTGALTSTSPNVDVAAPTTTPISCEEVAAMEGLPGMENMDHTCVGTTTSAVPFDPTATGGTGGEPIVESAPFGDGLALVTVAPGTVGTNTVSISLTDANGVSIDPDAAPTVEFRLREKSLGPISQTAERVGPGAYRVSQDFVLPGDWEVNVSAVLSDFDQPQAIVRIAVRG